MAKILFIHGGFGNALLQVAHVNRYEKSFVISNFFTSKLIRKFFGFTNHPNLLLDRVDLKEAGIKSAAVIPIIFLDIVIAKLFSYSLFTELDIGFVRAKPIFKKLSYFGYFQENIDLESIINVGHYLKPHHVNEVCTDNKVVVHVRGGDFIGTSQALDQEYYSKALKYIFMQDIYKDSELVLISNDLDYAYDLLKKSGLDKEKYSISSGLELDDFNLLHNCMCLISSNSTFALTAAITNPNNKTILIPKDRFNLKNNYAFSFIQI